MDNATIRTWAKANNVECPKNGNVPPSVTMLYLQAQDKVKAPKADKVKAPKADKVKAPKADKVASGPDLQAQFGELFSAGTIKMVLAQHPERALEILTTAQAFMSNGMKLRYVAIGKAIKGETPRIKGTETAPKADKVKAPKADKVKADSDAENGTQTRYGVILPGGMLVHVATEAEQANLIKIAPGAVAVQL